MDLWCQILEWSGRAAQLSLEAHELVLQWTPPLPLPLHFEPLHVLLLETFSIILLITLVLILISWKLYGKKISERFMKPATSKAIQELKDSVSRLKLPKEHTPRI